MRTQHIGPDELLVGVKVQLRADLTLDDSRRRRSTASRRSVRERVPAAQVDLHRAGHPRHDVLERGATDDRTSAYLGQFTDEVANEIAGELEAAEIWWSYKQASWITQIFFLGEWGTRLFVDARAARRGARRSPSA